MHGLLPMVQHWGYLAVFIGVMLESTGVPVPGETFIVLASFLAAQHALNPWEVYAAAVLGAILGDNLGYAVGRFGGRKLVRRLSAIGHVPSERIDSAERWFRHYGPAAVFFGRFIALLRMLSGPMAGLSRMPWLEFLSFNALGGLVWAGLVVWLSLLIGQTVLTYFHEADEALLALVLLPIVWLSLRFIWRRIRR